jgi:hypothetical protein
MRLWRRQFGHPVKCYWFACNNLPGTFYIELTAHFTLGGRLLPMTAMKNSTACLTLLSQLLLGSERCDGRNGISGDDLAPDWAPEIARTVALYARQDFGELWSLATSHHVILRSFPPLLEVMLWQGKQESHWCENAIAKERARIERAQSFLSEICEELGKAGDVVVIKSLDHWPDLGNDLDLYTNASAADVIVTMRERFKATLDERSWGDRLAGKWNFVVPGLPELVEVHVSRLGQTGEQVVITDSLVKRSRQVQFGRYSLRVPAPEDRLMICTLQRMYRHFYLRLCDIVDTARLVNSGAIDYEYLKPLAQSAGLWDGLATYLVTISGYVKFYCGTDLPLPPLVTSAARFGNELVHFRRKFLRIPIFPQAAKLYFTEWARLLLNGELGSTLRLSLLPGLAAAAALEFKLTGTDKGIW